MRPSLILTAAIAVLSTTAAPAFAQDASASVAVASDRLEFRLEANVDQICGAFTQSTGPTVVDFGDLAGVPSGQALPSRTVAADVVFICNEPNGFTRTVASQNGGALFRVGTPGGAGNEIPYLVGGTGPALAFAPRRLTAPEASNAVDPIFLAGTPGPLQVQINGVRGPQAANGIFGTTVFAGAYVDTLTISVTAN